MVNSRKQSLIEGGKKRAESSKKLAFEMNVAPMILVENMQTDTKPSVSSNDSDSLSDD